MVPAASDDLFTFNDDWRAVSLRTHIHHLFFTRHQQ